MKVIPSFRRLVSGLSSQRHGFSTRPVHMKLVAGQLSLWQLSVLACQICPVRIIPPVLLVHSSITDVNFLSKYQSHLLTYSMVQSPSWEANWFEASQEIPRISRNPKVHYRTHKCPPPVSILGQPNPVHIASSHLLEVRPNIIHQSTHRSPQWSLSLRFPHQEHIHPLSSPIRATCPAHLILLDFITRTTLTFVTPGMLVHYVTIKQ